MFNPTDTPPAILAPLFAASIISGPPPLITTRLMLLINLITLLKIYYLPMIKMKFN